MTPLIEELAKKAGFEYDPSDCNFYGEGWQNSYIVAMTNAIVNKCLTSIEESQGDLDYAVWKIRKDFGIEQ